MSDHVAYESLTVADPNPIKRYLHRRRYAQAVERMNLPGGDVSVLDFGTGSGELAHYIINKSPGAKVTLFEPSPEYAEEAAKNVAQYGAQVRVATGFDEVEGETFSHIFCLSIFEHLPPEQMDEALGRVHRVSTDETAILAEVPNEIYGAAALKGTLRHIRRPHEHDGRLGNIGKAIIGRPPTNRPVSNFDLSSEVELPWHAYHLGFDHRVLERTLNESGLFRVEGPSFAPIAVLGSLASLDVYYSLTRK